jgi:hypothetical protein
MIMTFVFGVLFGLVGAVLLLACLLLRALRPQKRTEAATKDVWAQNFWSRPDCKDFLGRRLASICMGRLDGHYAVEGIHSQRVPDETRDAMLDTFTQKGELPADLDAHTASALLRHALKEMLVAPILADRFGAGVDVTAESALRSECAELGGFSFFVLRQLINHLHQVVSCSDDSPRCQETLAARFAQVLFPAASSGFAGQHQMDVLSQHRRTWFWNANTYLKIL